MVLVTGLAVYKLAYHFLGAEGFSEYALCRRNITLTQPLLYLGLGVAIPRYMAYASARDRDPGGKKADDYFLSGLLMITITIMLATAVFNLLKGPIAFLLFGGAEYEYLILPINLALIGLMSFSVIYDYYRGKMLFLRANLVQFVNMGIVPLLAFFVGRNTSQVLAITGLIWLGIALVLMPFILRHIRYERNLWSHAKELFAYGVQRVPGDFANTALFAMPAILTAHIAGVEVAGFVAFGTSVVVMAGSAFTPIGLVLLPKASQAVANKDIRLLKTYVMGILKVTSLVMAGGILVFEVFASQIIHLYIGDASIDLVQVSRVMIIASLAYCVHVSLRSVLDAYYFRAANTLNMLLALLLFFILAGAAIVFSGEYFLILFSFVAAIYLLGFLTLSQTARALKRGQHEAGS